MSEDKSRTKKLLLIISAIPSLSILLYTFYFIFHDVQSIEELIYMIIFFAVIIIITIPMTLFVVKFIDNYVRKLKDGKI